MNQITAYARCTQDRIDRLQQSTLKDDTLALLKHTAQHGWPQTITESPPELRPYWTSREEISIEDGILLKGEQIIIPAVDQPDILPMSCKSLCVFAQPHRQLKELVTNCRVCLKYSQANCKDSKSIGPPLGQEIPTRPWAKLATDIFTFNNENYLSIVDYMSIASD